MDVKEFAEKYAGYDAHDKNGRHFIIAGWQYYGFGPNAPIRIIGMYDDAPEPPYGYKQDPAIPPRYWMCRFDWERMLEYCHFPIEEIVLDPKSINVPDDCLLCGAVGDEPCKGDCLNKE